MLAGCDDTAKEGAKMNVKYPVALTKEEKEYLTGLISEGRIQGYRIRHAQILLALDRSQGQIWSYQEIGKACQVKNPATITQIAKRYALEGLNAALGRKAQENRRRKVNREVEAHIVAIACSQAPEGRKRWTLHLIADELIRLEIVGSISKSTVCNALRKTNVCLGKRANGAS